MLNLICSSSSSSNSPSSSNNNTHISKKLTNSILWSLISWRSSRGRLIWMIRLSQCQTVLTHKASCCQIRVLLTLKSQSRSKTGISPSKSVRVTLMMNLTSLLLLMMRWTTESLQSDIWYYVWFRYLYLCIKLMSKKPFLKSHTANVTMH